MDLDQTMKALEEAGTAQNRKVYPRHGAREPMFGVSYADLGRLQKRIGTDQELALELWATGNHDARVLATRVADPEMMTARSADAWMRDVDNYVLGEAVAGLVARSPVGAGRARVWRGRKGEWPSSVGWAVTASLALADGALSDDECRELLIRIEEEMPTRANRTRHEMNGALIAIGVGHPRSCDQAVAAARRIGPVSVDHGETGCRTPDAVDYIQRAVARRH